MSNLRLRRTVRFAEGAALERLLADLDKQGYDVEHLFNYGNRPVQHPIDPHKMGIIPLFVVIAKLNPLLVAKDA